MLAGRWLIIFLAVSVEVAPFETHAAAKSFSQDEAGALWEELLRDERYVGLSLLQSGALDEYRFQGEKRLRVHEDTGYLGGLWGLSGGGGWDIEGWLEGEVTTDRGIAQLYSKATINWHPSFWWVWMSGYDPEKWPQWEFQLVLRNSSDRRKIRVLKSVQLSPQEIISPFPLGQRTPRNSLQYDRARRMAIIEILGVHHPVRLEVPVGLKDSN